jgi:hypothetical protein
VNSANLTLQLACFLPQPFVVGCSLRLICNEAMAFVLPNSVRRARLHGKQPAPAHLAHPPSIIAALQDEAWAELTSLGQDARRKHMHWVQVRTQDRNQRQPESFTRAGFYRHMEDVYRHVYGDASSASGSILMFGLVAKERHLASAKSQERDEHHHCIVYCSAKHYWKPVAERSLALGVKLHAACHDGYTVMYAYLRNPTVKKPLSELDAEAWFSERHPRGTELSQLLKTGAEVTKWLHKKRKGRSAEAEPRFRVADLFALTAKENIRDVRQLKLRASDQAKQGDERLAEFCTCHREQELQEYLDNAWSIHEAPQRAAAENLDRLGKLQQASTGPCECRGVLEGSLRFILHHHQEDVTTFCSDVLHLLRVGAARGANLAIVGVPGCGKSTMFESLGKIFELCAKPEIGSTFVLAEVLDAQPDVLLWQEFTWDPKGCSFEDLLAVLAGEKVGIRRPGQASKTCRISAPMIYTSWQPLTMICKDPARMFALNTAMAERFKTRVWCRPLPQAGRVSPFPHCGSCYAKFLLSNGR